MVVSHDESESRSLRDEECFAFEEHVVLHGKRDPRDQGGFPNTRHALEISNLRAPNVCSSIDIGDCDR